MGGCSRPIDEAAVREWCYCSRWSVRLSDVAVACIASWVRGTEQRGTHRSSNLWRGLKRLGNVSSEMGQRVFKCATSVKCQKIFEPWCKENGTRNEQYIKVSPTSITIRSPALITIRFLRKYFKITISVFCDQSTVSENSMWVYPRWLGTVWHSDAGRLL